MTKCNILHNWLLRHGWGFIKLAQIACVNKTLKDETNADICEKLRAIREAEEGLDMI